MCSHLPQTCQGYCERDDAKRLLPSPSLVGCRCTKEEAQWATRRCAMRRCLFLCGVRGPQGTAEPRLAQARRVGSVPWQFRRSPIRWQSKLHDDTRSTYEVRAACASAFGCRTIRCTLTGGSCVSRTRRALPTIDCKQPRYAVTVQPSVVRSFVTAIDDRVSRYSVPSRTNNASQKPTRRGLTVRGEQRCEPDSRV
jgi:hypothetical protein